MFDLLSLFYISIDPFCFKRFKLVQNIIHVNWPFKFETWLIDCTCGHTWMPLQYTNHFFFILKKKSVTLKVL